MGSANDSLTPKEREALEALLGKQTQAKLAEELNTSESTISRLRSGKRVRAAVVQSVVGLLRTHGFLTSSSRTLPPAPERYRIADYSELLTLGWSADAIYEAAVDVFLQSLQERGARREAMGDKTTFMEKYAEMPDLGSFVVDQCTKGRRKTIVGFWDMVVLDQSSSAYKAFRNGTGEINSIRYRDMASIDMGGEFCAYVDAFCILPEHQKISSRQKMVGSMLNALRKLYGIRVVLSEVCACAWTPSAASMCESFGLQQVANRAFGVYAGPPKFRFDRPLWRDFGDLRAVYG